VELFVRSEQMRARQPPSCTDCPVSAHFHFGRDQAEMGVHWTGQCYRNFTALCWWRAETGHSRKAFSRQELLLVWSHWSRTHLTAQSRPYVVGP
jgi:hypothetical protein